MVGGINMRAYYISTEAKEDKPAMTCVYPYRQWIELIKYFKENSIKFKAWSEII